MSICQTEPWRVLKRGSWRFVGDGNNLYGLYQLLISGAYNKFIPHKQPMKYSNNPKQIKSAVELNASPNVGVEKKSTTPKKVFTRKPGNAGVCRTAEREKERMDQSMTSIDAVLLNANVLQVESQNVSNLTSLRRERLSSLYPIKREATLQSPSRQKPQFLSKIRVEIQGLKKAATNGSKNSNKNGLLENCEGQQFQKGDNQPFIRPNFKYANGKAKEFEDTQQNFPAQGLKFRTGSAGNLKDFCVKVTSFQKQSPLGKATSDKSIAAECCYCKNNKKIVDILNEKYAKLQEHLNVRMHTIRDISDKYENLKIDNGFMVQKIERQAEQMKAQQAYFLKSREELIERMEGLNNQIGRLKEKLKYNEIERAMLLRLKSEHVVVMRQNERLKYENEQLRKSKDNNREKHSSFARRKVEDMVLPSPAAEINNIYYDCEDDNISLNLSEY